MKHDLVHLHNCPHFLGHKCNCAEDTESKKAYVIVTPLCNYPLPDTYGRQVTNIDDELCLHSL